MFKIINIPLLLALLVLSSANLPALQNSGPQKPDLFQSMGSNQSSSSLSETPKQDVKNIELDDDSFGALSSQIREMKESLGALEGIYNSNGSNDKKDSVLLKMAILNYKIGLALRPSANNNNQIQESIRYFQKALGHVGDFLNGNGVKNRSLLTGYYLRGLILGQLKMPTAQITSLEKAASLDPNGPLSKNIGIMLAELYFDSHDYQKSYQNYQKQLSKLDVKQKATAYYKMGWCLELLGKHNEAIDYFITIIKNREYLVVHPNSIRDLAYVATQALTDDQILALGHKRVNEPSLETVFIYNCIRYFYYRKERTFKTKLFQSLLNRNIDSETRVFLLNIYLDSKKSPIPHISYREALEFVLSDLNNHGLSIESKAFSAGSKDLELISEFFVKQYIDLKAGKLQNQARLSTKQVSDELIYHIKFHIRTFHESRFWVALFELGIQTESQSPNPNLDFYREQLVLQNRITKEQNKTLSNQITYHEILNLDSKVKTDPSQMPLLQRKLEESVSPNDSGDITRKSPSPPFISQEIDDKLRLRLFLVYFDSAQYNKAKLIIERLYEQHPGVEYRNNLLLTLFKMGNYEELIRRSKTNEDLNSSLANDLIREAHLKLAANQSNKNENFDFTAFESNIRNFIGLSTDPNKKATATLDYFNKIMKYKDEAYLIGAWDKTDSNIQGNPQLDEFRLTQIVALFSKNKLDEARKLTLPITNENFTVFALILGLVSPNRTLPWSAIKQWDQLSTKQRDYLLSIIAQIRPMDTVNYFRRSTKSLSIDQQKIFYRSIQTSQTSFTPLLSEIDSRLLNSLKIEKEIPDSKFMSLLSGFNFTNLPNDSDKKNRVIKDYVTKSEQLVNWVNSKSGGWTLSQRIDYLGKVSAIEGSLADLIQSVPHPQGLNENEIQEYTTKINIFANNYRQKKSEFDATIAQLKEIQKKNDLNLKSRILPKLKTDDWLNVTTPYTSTLKSLFDSYQIDGPILLLEVLNSNSKISQSEYWKLKSLYIYRSFGNNPIAMSFLRADLEFYKQTDIIDQWMR